MKVEELEKLVEMPNVAKAVQLDPDSRYIMVVRGPEMEQKSVEFIQKYLREAQGLNVVILSVKPETDISFYELQPGAPV